MVNRGFIGGSDSGSASLSATGFAPLAGTIVSNATEANIQTVVRNPGVFHDFTTRVTSGFAGTSLSFRKNAALGNQTVSTAATGLVRDVTHTDTVVATDKINWARAVSGSTSHSIISVLFDSTTNFSTRGNMSTQQTWTTGSSYSMINGFMATNASNEPGIQTKQQIAGVMKYLQCNLSANAKTSTFTFISRRNTAAGAMTITIPASPSGTGIFEDSTNQDTINVNDLWNTSRVVGTDTTSSTTWQLTAQDFIVSASQQFIVETGADADVAGGLSATVYVAVGGRFNTTSTEANVQGYALGNFTYSKLTIHQTTGPSTNTATVRFRKNTANGNMNVTSGTATGIYTDSTNVDTVLPTDLINISIQCGSGTVPSFSKAFVYGQFAATYPRTVLVEFEE